MRDLDLAIESDNVSGSETAGAHRKRIVIVNQYYAPDISPTAVLATSLARGLAARGHDVSVVTSRGSYAATSGRMNAPSASAEGAVRVRWVWTPLFGRGGMLPRALEYAFFLCGALIACTLRRADVVICMTTPPFIAFAGVPSRLLRPSTRLIYWCMDLYPDVAERLDMIRSGGFASRVLRRINRLLFRHVDRFVALDGAMQHLIADGYLGGARDRVSVIPNWEESSRFLRSDAPPTWQAPLVDELKGRFVIAYLGNLGRGHHFDSIIEAAARLADRPVALLFVGGGAGWPHLRKTIATRGLTNVFLHPYVPPAEAIAIMAASDVALITLKDEALGIISPSKLHASLAMGLPILYLGPKGSNVDEAVQRFECGVSLRRDDVAGIVDFIEEALPRGPRYASLSRNARHAFEAAYTEKAAVESFVALLGDNAATRCGAVATSPD